MDPVLPIYPLVKSGAATGLNIRRVFGPAVAARRGA
jgi:hypothetical protein